MAPGSQGAERDESSTGMRYATRRSARKSPGNPSSMGMTLTRSASSGHETVPFFEDLFQYLESFSSSKDRCRDAIRAILDLNCILPTNDGKDRKKPSNPPDMVQQQPETPSHDANVIIICTHVINRLIQELSNDSGDSKKVTGHKERSEQFHKGVILSGLTYLISKILLSDRTTLEQSLKTFEATTTMSSTLSERVCTIPRNAELSTDTNSFASNRDMEAKGILSKALISCIKGSTLAVSTLVHDITQESASDPNEKKKNPSSTSTAYYHGQTCKKGKKRSASEALQSNSQDDLKGTIHWTQRCLYSNLITLENYKSGLSWNDQGHHYSIKKAIEKDIPDKAFSSTSEDNVNPLNTTQVLVWDYLCHVLVHCTDLHWKLDDVALTSFSEGEDVSLKGICRHMAEVFDVNHSVESTAFHTFLFNPLSRPTTGTRASTSNDLDLQLRTQAQVVDVLNSQTFNHITFESRMFTKTLSGVTFVWCSNGQKLLLQALVSMLNSDLNIAYGQNWDAIMTPRCIAQKQEFSYSSSITEETLHEAKKKRRRKNKNDSTVEKLNIPGNVALVTYAARMISVIYDLAKASGSRRPDRGMDKYSMLISRQDGLIENDGIKNPSRPLICDESVQVAYLLLKTHHRCLEQNIEVQRTEDGTHKDVCFLFSEVFPLDGISMGHLLVNESGNGNADMGILHLQRDVIPHSKFHPFMSCTLETLARIPCIVGSSSAFDESDMTSNLMAITSALAMKYGMVTCERRGIQRRDEDHIYVVLDTKLCSMATKRLNSTLENILTYSSGIGASQIDGTKIQDSQVQDFFLNEPLAPNFSDSDPGCHSDYAGLTIIKNAGQGCLNGRCLSYFIRATLPEGSKKKQAARRENSVQSMIKSLMRMVDCYYAAIRSDSVESNLASTRCQNVVDCLTALRKCLCIAPGSSRSSGDRSASMSLRSYLRHQCIKPAIVRHFIELGQILQQTILEKRRFGEKDAENEEIGIQTQSRYESYERIIWGAHVKLALTIGRGNATSETSKSTMHSLLGTVADKLTIFKTFGFISKGNGSEEDTNHYILYLSSLHHALVAANLTSELPPRSMKEATVERLLCDTFISSICACLKNPSLCLHRNERCGLLDDFIPLSRKDVRLFLLAVCRLPRKDQVKTLSRTVKMLDECFTEIDKALSLRELYINEKDISGFLARVIITISTMVDLVGGGKGLCDLFVQQVGRSYYNYPTNLIRTCDEDGDVSDGYEWFNCETHFMSIFNDCETVALPVVELDDLNSPLSSKDFTTLSKIYETALSLSFESAQQDYTHLLFSCWNASGKLCAWDPKKSHPQFSVTKFNKLGICAKVFLIRDHMCNTFKVIENDERTMPDISDSFLSKVLKKRGYMQSFGQYGSSTFVKEGVKHSTAILESMLDNVTAENHVEPTTIGEFILLEAVVIFQSFFISMCTTSNNEAFLSMISNNDKSQKRKDSNVSGDSLESLEDAAYCDVSDESIESESGEHDFLEEEDDDDYESRLDGLNRLHDVCNMIGASPFHPDWLDSQCRLRQGISLSDAMTASEQALKALTKVCSRSFLHYTKAISNVLELSSKQGKQCSFQLPLVLLSLTPEPLSNAESYDDDRDVTTEWNEIVCNLCDIDVSTINTLLHEVPSATPTSVKETFCPHSTQRIRGKLRDFISLDRCVGTLPEYRAGSEWELILSETLLGSHLRFGMSEKESEVKTCKEGTSGEEKALSVQNLLENAARWSRVLHSTVSSMVTITALLRMCHQSGKGREKHPLNKNSTDGSYSKQSYDRSKFVSNKVDSRMTVTEALQLLAEIASCGFVGKTIQQSARAAADHLVINRSDFDVILRVRSWKNALNCLEMISSSDYLHQHKNDLANPVIERIIDVIDEIEREEKDSPYEFPICSHLLSCLGVPNATKIDSIADESGVEVTNILFHRNSEKVKSSSDIYFINWEEGIQTTQVKLLLHICTRQCLLGLNSIVRSKVITMLKKILQTDDYCIRRETDGSVYDSELKSTISQFWNQVGLNTIKDLVEHDICNIDNATTSHQVSISTSQELSFIIARISGSQSDNSACRVVLQEIRENLQHWIRNRDTDHIVGLLYVLATRYGEMSSIGEDLLSLAMIESSNDKSSSQSRGLIVLETFYRFIRDTKLKIEEELQRGKAPSDFNSYSFSAHGKSESSQSGTDDAQTPRQCTYVATGVDFSEQHWYNCYTCGLIWDKGCCSLCAQICHKGHDVGYSRKSSFFCDCGAESSSMGNGFSCKCIKGVDEKTWSQLHGFRKAPSRIDSIDATMTRESCHTDDMSLLEVATYIASSDFPSISLSNINNFIEGARQNGLTQKLFDLFDSYVEVWDKTNDLKSLNFDSYDTSSSNVIGMQRNSYDSLDLQLHCRCGKSMDVSFLGAEPLTFLRGTKQNSINPRISSDCNTDRKKGAFLSKNELKRNAVAVDNRGRMIVAEQCSLLFVAVLPAVNIRYATAPEESLFGRTDLSILGSEEVSFSILGMNVCREEGSKLVVWGSSNAAVFVLSKSCERKEMRIDLKLDLDDDECDRDYILRAEWVSGSYGHIVAVFGSTFVKFFDVRASDSSTTNVRGVCSCAHHSHYILNYEDVKVRSGVIIPRQNDTETNESIDYRFYQENRKAYKIGLLFDTGRMHFFQIEILDGHLKGKGESYIDYGDPYPFPTTGISRSINTSIGLPGSTSLSFGKGSSLIYLNQSHILLYKCLSSSMIAFVLDKSGSIIGSFELLPHVIKHDMLGNDHPSGSISGPYTNWNELGIIERNGVSFYRVSFVGRSIANNQPKVLCLEFNQHEVKVCEIKSASLTRSLGANLNTSFEGMATFSGPHFSGLGSETGFASEEGKIIERAYLVAFTANGSMLIFGEEAEEECTTKNEVTPTFRFPKTTGTIKGSKFSNISVTGNRGNSGLESHGLTVANSRIAQPRFPLTIFEDLINITERDDLKLFLQGIELASGKRELNVKDIKKKTNGCTLILSFRDGNSTRMAGNHNGQRSSRIEDAPTDEKKEPCSLVIAGVRILLGSVKTESMPRKIVIMGRPIDYTQGIKRWYDVPFTDEEILLGARTGFIPINIDGSFDSMRNLSIVDSIEVYAQERARKPDLFPVAKHWKDNFNVSSRAPMSKQGTTAIAHPSEEEKHRGVLNASILAVTHTFQLFDQNQDQSQLNLQTLKRLIQITALHSMEEGDVRANVVALLGEVKSDEQGRQTLLDEGTLLGISEILKHMSTFPVRKDDSVEDAMEADKYARNDSGKTSPKCVRTLNDCVAKALHVIKRRPSTYRACVHNLTRAGTIDRSISQEAMKVHHRFQETMYVCSIAPVLVELALLEAIVIDETPSAPFLAPGLNMVSATLRSEDETVVKDCCKTVTEVFRKALSHSHSGSESHSNDDAPPVRNAYQCDGCNMVPIEGIRYSHEEGHDIDLCQNCYDEGYSFAKDKAFSQRTAVVINRKKLRIAAQQMTCAHMKQMQPMALSNEQGLDGIEEDDDSSNLQIALKMSLETQEESISSWRIVQQMVFDRILQDVSTSLSPAEAGMIPHPIPVMELLLSMVFETSPREDEVRFGRQMCASLCEQMSFTCEALSKATAGEVDSVILKRKRFSFVFCARAMSCLLSKSITLEEERKQNLEEKDAETNTNIALTAHEKTRLSKLSCSVHGVPAVKRRCSSGENSGRRFYLCGMERKHRCDFFKWADEVDWKDKGALTDGRPHNSSSDDSISSHSTQQEEIDPTIQQFIWNLFNDGSLSLQLQLCNLVQDSVKNVHEDNSHPKKFITTQRESPSETVGAALFNSDSAQNGKMSNKEDDQDGVFLSLKKLVWHRDRKDLQKRLERNMPCLISSGETSVIESSLELLSYVTANALNQAPNNQLEAWEGWFAPLCEIISTRSSSQLRLVSKKILKRLCGGRLATYHKVRYHYVFGFHFMKLLIHCKQVLQAALEVREKAHRCGTAWMSSEIVWTNLCSGGLIGVQDLISEDSHTCETIQSVNKILDELIAMTKNRKNHWRQFCSSMQLPRKHSRDMLERGNSGAWVFQNGLINRPPICIMLWIACSLPTLSQVKIFQLMALALNPANGDGTSAIVPGSTQIQGDQCGVFSTDTGTDLESNQPKGYDESLNRTESQSPEAILFNDDSGLTSNDVHAFIIHFVLNGNDKSLRSTAADIACGLIRSLPTDEMDTAFKRLSVVCMRDIGILGCQATEFLKMLNSCFSYVEVTRNIDISYFVKTIITCFKKQSSSMQDSRLSIEGKDALVLEVNKIENKGRVTFDLATCTFCHRQKEQADAVERDQTESDVSSLQHDITAFNKCNIRSRAADMAESNEESAVLADQMKEMETSILDKSTLHTVCTEFAKFVQLKDRLRITEIHLSVSEPRGRYVKTVGVFFSPRPVNNVNELKKAEYAELWQRCGTLSLSRGACRSMCKLSIPIIASNLKFEYEEFYEKGNSSRSSNGSLVIHCPRCTRVVNNSHGGVCGHCGEVAFQCRKCRHINYDRLDAFLCVECGYCASGTFAYELSCGTATNAVAITNDQDLERSVRYLRTSMKKVIEIRSALVKKVANTSASKSKRSRSARDTFDGLANYCSPLKRALSGELPKMNSRAQDDQSSDHSSTSKKRKANSDSISSSNRSESISVANKTRSLLSLAHQIRREASGGSDDRHRDILVQQAILNSAGNFDVLDESESDVLGLLNGYGEGNAMHSDLPDPLTRLVANIQARVRGNSTANSLRRTSANSEGQEPRNEEASAVETETDPSKRRSNEIKECTTLHQQLKGAERDSFDLQRRIAAWKRLNRDELAGEIGFTKSIPTYTPVQCSNCASNITRSILEIASTLFSGDAMECEKALDMEFIRLLFEESKHLGNDLLALKRSLIITIAMRFQSGSMMILHELQTRLHNTTGEGIAAEILGQLLEKDFETVESFIKLALKTLNMSDK